MVRIEHGIRNVAGHMLGTEALHSFRCSFVVSDRQLDAFVSEDLGANNRSDADKAKWFARPCTASIAADTSASTLILGPSTAKLQRFFAAPKPPGKISASTSSALNSERG